MNTDISPSHLTFQFRSIIASFPGELVLRPVVRTRLYKSSFKIRNIYADHFLCEGR